MRDGSYNIILDNGNEKQIHIKDGEVQFANLVNEDGELIEEIKDSKESLLKELEDEITGRREQIEELSAEMAVDDSRNNLPDGTYYLEMEMDEGQQQEYEAYRIIDDQVQSARVEGGKRGDVLVEIFDRNDLKDNDKLQEAIIDRVNNYIDEHHPDNFKESMFRPAWKGQYIEDGEYRLPSNLDDQANIIRMEHGVVKDFYREYENGENAMLPFEVNLKDMEHQKIITDALQEKIYYHQKHEFQDRKQERELNQSNKNEIDHDELPF